MRRKLSLEDCDAILKQSRRHTNYHTSRCRLHIQVISYIGLRTTTLIVVYNYQIHIKWSTIIIWHKHWWLTPRPSVPHTRADSDRECCSSFQQHKSTTQSIQDSENKQAHHSKTLDAIYINAQNKYNLQLVMRFRSFAEFENTRRTFSIWWKSIILRSRGYTLI